MSKETKILISKGCTDFLIQEIDSLRSINDRQSAQLQIVNGFFNLIDRLGDKSRQGYGTDDLWQAKREIDEAVKEATKARPE
jgi:hypothetical protein